MSIKKKLKASMVSFWELSVNAVQTFTLQSTTPTA